MLCFVSQVNTGLRTSPNVDEIAHLAAGIRSAHSGRFDVYKVNPPLVKLVAALPVCVCQPNECSLEPVLADKLRNEWHHGYAFLGANVDSMWLFWSLARIACGLFTLVGLISAAKWANSIGPNTGIIVLILWLFSPTMQAWGATIGTDVPAAALGVATCYTFRNWLRSPDAPNAMIAGICLGFCELTKTTWVILLPMLPSIWIVARLCQRRAGMLRQQSRQIVMMMLLALFVLNSCYQFQGSFTAIGDYRFHSQTLAGHAAHDQGGNRFTGTLLGKIPIPFPRPYVEGIDLQKVDFEIGLESFLRGEWRKPGWHYWYLYAALVKVPLGTLFLLGTTIAIGLSAVLKAPVFRSNRGANATDKTISLEDKLCLILPPIAVLILVSSQTGFTIYFRYVVPAFPFVYILIAQLANHKSTWIRWLVPICLVASGLSTASVYPHCMEFFNVAVGGSAHGHRHLLHASYDFGQNGYYLRDWLCENPEVNKVHFDLFYRPPLFALGLEQTKEADARWIVLCQTKLWGRTNKYAFLRERKPYARLPGGLVVFRKDWKERPSALAIGD